jgi:hypothetical protein
MEQMKDAVDIFEVIHPDAVGVWAFDCSSAHKGLAPDALNVNRMNINSGGKQTVLIIILYQETFIRNADIKCRHGGGGKRKRRWQSGGGKR